MTKPTDIKTAVKTPQTKTKSAKNTTTKAASTPPASSMISENSKITFTIARATIATEYQKILAAFAKTTAAPGFRKGKAPLEIVESIVGRTKLLEKTFEKVAPNAYYDAIIAAKLHPITNPEFNPLKIPVDGDWEIEAFFAQRPEITLGAYTRTVATALKAAESEISANQKAEAEITKADKTTQKATKQPTLTPEQIQQQQREIKLKHVFKALVSAIKPVVPELLVRQETRYELDNLLRQLDQFGLKLEHYVAKRQITTEVLSQELAATALGRLQLEFVLGAIANDQKLTASEAEIDKAIAMMSDENLRNQLHANAEYRRQIEASVIRQKVMDFLLQ